jgi:hypothetical protein
MNFEFELFNIEQRREPLQANQLRAPRSKQGAN